MTLECLGSSSSGNCYLLKAKGEVLVLECGMPLRDVAKALGWDTSRIAGCVVSHEHDDHAKHLGEYLKRGIKALALADVFAAKGLSGCAFAQIINPKRGYRVGGFKILGLSVLHDVPCLGFMIEHAEMGRLLFVTDTMAFPYRLPRLNHVMIEANYSDAILDANIERGITPASMRGRLLKSHMEIGTTESILRGLDLREANEVVLVHLSGQNSSAAAFRERIMGAVGKPVYVADKGMEIDISANPY